MSPRDIRDGTRSGEYLISVGFWNNSLCRFSKTMFVSGVPGMIFCRCERVSKIRTTVCELVFSDSCMVFHFSEVNASPLEVAVYFPPNVRISAAREVALCQVGQASEGVDAALNIRVNCQVMARELNHGG